MSENPAQRVAARVQAEMWEQKISQQALARLIGMSQSAFSRRMTGEVPFAIDELHRIGIALKKPMAHFVPGDEPELAMQGTGRPEAPGRPDTTGPDERT